MNSAFDMNSGSNRFRPSTAIGYRNCSRYSERANLAGIGARFRSRRLFGKALKYLLVCHRSYAPGQRLSIFGVAAQALTQFPVWHANRNNQWWIDCALPPKLARVAQPESVMAQLLPEEFRNEDP
jgi:hypothetical protein